jgi:transposase
MQNGILTTTGVVLGMPGTQNYAGIDVSLELASVCIVDANGKVVKETKLESHPNALVALFNDLRLPMAQIGLEAGPLSRWLHAGLTQAGFETVLLETRHVKAALSAMTVKTDRKDARGIARFLRMLGCQCLGKPPDRFQEPCHSAHRTLAQRRLQLREHLLDGTEIGRVAMGPHPGWMFLQRKKQHRFRFLSLL